MAQGEETQGLKVRRRSGSRGGDAAAQGEETQTPLDRCVNTQPRFKKGLDKPCALTLKSDEHEDVN